MYSAPGSRASRGSDRPQLSVIDYWHVELPRREPLPHLGDRGPENAALLRGGRGAETVPGRLRLSGEPRLATLFRKQPGVAIAGEDDVREHVAHGIGDQCASPLVERRHATAEERPRERHVTRAVDGDEPERGAHGLICGLLQMAHVKIEIELIVERPERRDVCFDRKVTVERSLSERMIAGPRQIRLARIRLVATESLRQHVTDLEMLSFLRRTERQEQ